MVRSSKAVWQTNVLNDNLSMLNDRNRMLNNTAFPQSLAAIDFSKIHRARGGFEYKGGNQRFPIFRLPPCAQCQNDTQAAERENTTERRRSEPVAKEHRRRNERKTAAKWQKKARAGLTAGPCLLYKKLKQR